MKVATLRDVLVDELQDLFDAEKQLVRALPKMARSASHPDLEKLFREHLEVTKGQVKRLEQAFGALDQRPRSKPCAGMKGLVEEQQEIASEDRQASMLDAGLLGAARKVEHYEIAGYANTVAIAQQLGEREVAKLLNETLKEETRTEKRLAQVGKKLVKEASRMMQSGEVQPRRGRRAQKRAVGRKTARVAGTSRGTQARGRRRGAAAQPLIDHEEIRRWAEARHAQPSRVKGTGRGAGDTGMIRLDFPGYSGRESLEPISWNEWFDAFDANDLALMVQEETARGQKSNFNKIVSRQTVQARSKPRVKRAGG